jgi:hypothetical protein
VVSSRPRRRQVRVLYLEPRRAGATIAYSVLTLIAAAVAVAAVTYPTASWAESLRQNADISDTAARITATVAAGLALIFVTAAILNGRRWHTARIVQRLSNDPMLAAITPNKEWQPATEIATTIPLLEIRFINARKFPKPTHKLRRVTPDRNVVGHVPLRIAFLRLFENQPRMRTYMQSAWREFGEVHFLRSAESVTSAEYRSFKKSGAAATALFVCSREQFLDATEGHREPPLSRGRHTYKSIGASRIRVRDRYGSYPVRAVLCHGSIWQDAIDLLLERVDLVTLDLSGFTPNNAGTRWELQRVIDRVPIDRVIFLADEQSDSRFLADQLNGTWSHMASGSPNAVPERRVAVVAITDHFQQSEQQQGNTTQVRVRLVARRSYTRRVANMAQDHLDASIGV